MIKKLIAFTFVILLPVSMNSAASAASKSITCYKGAVSKVVKGNNPKCPKGWSSKKPANPNRVDSNIDKAFKVKDISPSEALKIIDLLTILGEAQMQDNRNNQECANKDETIEKFNYKIIVIQHDIAINNRSQAATQRRIADPNRRQGDKISDQETMDRLISEMKGLNVNLVDAKAKLQEKTIWLTTCENLVPKLNVELDKYFPKDGSTDVKVVTGKLVDNFCGLNNQLLKQNDAILTLTDPMIGYEKYSQAIMKVFNENLIQIQSNSKLSVNTQSTDAILNILYPDKQFNYINVANLYDIVTWDKTLVKSEYGISVVSPEFNLLRDKLKRTVSYCSKR